MSLLPKDSPSQPPHSMGNDHVVDLSLLVTRLREWTDPMTSDNPSVHAASAPVGTNLSQLIQQVLDLLPRVAAVGLRQTPDRLSRYKELPATSPLDRRDLVLISPLATRDVQQECRRLAEVLGEVNQDLGELEGYLADVGARLSSDNQPPLKTSTSSDYLDHGTELPPDDTNALPW